MERTLIIIKPDSVKYAGKFITMIQEDLVCKITKLKMMELTREQAEILYEEQSKLPKFDFFAEYIFNKPIIAMTVEGPNIIKNYRLLIEKLSTVYSKCVPNATDDQKNALNNAIHCSDSDNADREIKLIFGI